MDKDQQIRDGFMNLAAQVGPSPTLLGIVKSVDEGNQTCVIDDDGLETPDVRLRPVLNGNQSLVMFPKVGSYAIAIRIEKTEEWMMIGADETTKIIAKTGDLIFTLGEEKASLQKQENSLFDLLKKIIESVLQIVVVEGEGPDIEKLTDALAQLNNLME